MNMYDAINKKKHGEKLSDEEIRNIILGYTGGDIPDYQMSALLMAIYFSGMSDSEIFALTDAMAHSGDTLDLSCFGGLSADKHSTGGVGDKTTLIVAPLAAALGCKVAKMSGRGLGHTGGTIDKLESIPGYNATLSPEEFFRQVENIGISVISQSGNLAPADKKIYALRDVTATVDSIPLICSSIMSKKLAAGASSIVLDVKCGSGSFMKTPMEALKIAELMVRIGKACGKKCAALITDMDTPLGYAIGNSLEVCEAIDVLSGNGPADLRYISIHLAAAMANLALGIPHEEAVARAEELLNSGSAMEKFKEWITAQGGDSSYLTDTSLFPKAKYSRTVFAARGGYISKMNSEEIGLAASELGAGRVTKDSPIDHSAGIYLLKKTGDAVSEGEAIAELYSSDEKMLGYASIRFQSAIEISDAECSRQKIIYKTLF